MTQETTKSASSPPAIKVPEKVIFAKPPKAPFFLRTVPLWGIVLATGVWAFNGKIPVEVSAKTILVTPRSNIPVQTRSGGQVLQLNIRPGEIVKKGEVLAILDLPELKDELISKQQKLRELQGQKRDLTQVQNRTNLLQKQTLQSQQLTIPKQTEAIKQQIVANQREIAAFRQQIAVKQTEIRAYGQRVAQLRERNKLLSPRLESGKNLIAEGAIAPLSMDIIQVQKQVQDNDIQVTQMQVQSNDARAKIEQLQSNLVGDQAKEKDLINQIRNLEAQLTGLGAQLEQIEYTTLQPTFRRLVSKVNNIFGKRKREKTEYVDVQGLS